jgi:hypothetical protein
MDEALAERLAQERAAAVRLYRFAKAVRTAYLDEDAKTGSPIELPPPCDGLSATRNDADAKIAGQDPSLKALVNAIKADGEASLGGESVATRRDISLLQWWALFGDFEIGLQRRLGDESSAERSKWRPFSGQRKASTSASHFKEGRVELVRGAGDAGPKSLHPIAWYLQSNATGKVDGRSVGELLLLHGTGGWSTWLDVLCEFYDAVTHAAARTYATSWIPPASSPPGDSAFAKRSAELAKKITDSARDLGINLSESRGQAADEIVFSPCGTWPNEEAVVCLRPALHNGSRRITPISMRARPVAYARMPGEQTSWNSRVSELIRQADDSWPEHESFGKWLAQAMMDPTRQVAEALGATGCFLGRSLVAAADRVSGLSEDKFLLNLRNVLKRGGAAIVDSETSSRRLATRSARDGRWALSIDAGALTIPLGVAAKSTCPSQLLDAIDRYDQCVWASATIAEISRNPVWGEAMEAFLASGAWGEPWERVKGQLLDLPDEPASSQIAEVFHSLRKMSLRLEQALSKHEPSGTGSTSAPDTLLARNLLRDVVGVVLRMPGGNGRDVRCDFWPPRLVDGPSAGDVDIGKWLEDPWWYGGESGQFQCDFKVVASRRDVVRILEDIAGVGRSFTVSLPFATEADETLSACPGALIWSDGGSPPGYARTIHECLRTPVQHAIRNRLKIDFSAALEQLRNRFATSDADRFHEMVELATDGDSRASACLSMLQSDKRLGLVCYPEVSECGGKVTLPPPSPADSILKFQFDASPRGETIEVHFATSRDKAIRTVSRGPKDPTGLQTLAFSIREWRRTLSDALQRDLKNITNEIMAGSDRREMFGEPLTKAIAAAGSLLQVIAQSGNEDAAATFPAAQRDDGFQRVKAWLSAAGAQVEPDAWSCEQGADSMPAEAQESAPEFNAHVPQGRVVVKGFGLFDRTTGTRVSRVQGCRSAGPPPRHYQKLLSLGDAPGGERLVAWLRRLAEKKLQGHEPYRSDVYELYSILSVGRYRRETGAAPEWDLQSDVFASARDLVEEWYEREFDCEAFPKEKDIVEVYSDIEKSEIRNLTPGEIEGGLVRVVVRGFKSRTGKILQARVYKEPLS